MQTYLQIVLCNITSSHVSTSDISIRTHARAFSTSWFVNLPGKYKKLNGNAKFPPILCRKFKTLNFRRRLSRGTIDEQFSPREGNATILSPSPRLQFREKNIARVPILTKTDSLRDRRGYRVLLTVTGGGRACWK